jgi:hypothetical protein
VPFSLVAVAPAAALHDCPPGAEEWQGREIDTSISMAPWDTRRLQISADGRSFAGSVTEAAGEFSATWNWEMTGSP